MSTPVIPNVWHAAVLDALRAQPVMAAPRSSVYERAVARTVKHPPTAEEWAEYERVKAAFETIKDSPYLRSEDGGVWVEEPCWRIEYVYAETEEEWRERVALLPKTVTIPFLKP